MDHTSINEDPSEETLREHQSKWRVVCHCIPKRYVVAILSFFGFLNVYALRVNLSIALVAMVSNRTIYDSNGNKNVTQPAEFKWNSKDQGIILSSFFYGYIFTQIPGGYLAARFGGKNLYGGGILMTALFTLLTPLAARGNMYMLIAIRVLEGLFEGVTFPCMHAIWSKWAPPMERSKLSSISFSGPFAGTVIGMTLSGAIAHNHGWPAVFYFFGILGIIWSVFWFWLITDSPFDHPTITDQELEYLKKELADDKTESTVNDIPWKQIMTSVPMWAIIVAHVSENWGYYTLLTSLPTYMKKVLKFDLQKTGFLAALPYLVMMIIVQCGGRLADFLRLRKILSTTAVRKTFNTLGFLAQGVFILIVGFTLNKDIAVLALTLAVGFGGLAWSGFIINHLDIAPRYASLLLGISNCFATVPGMLSPTVVGIITVNETQEEWRYVFGISSAIYAFGMIFYFLFASGNKQPWAQSNEYEQMSLLTDDDEDEQQQQGETELLNDEQDDRMLELKETADK